MNVAGFRKLYEYNDWANDRMLAAISALSKEQFTREIVSSAVRAVAAGGSVIVLTLLRSDVTP